MNKIKEPYRRDDFIACNWSYDVPAENHYGYSSVMRSLEDKAREKLEAGFEKQKEILILLAKCASMILSPDSLNEPFKPCFQDFQANTRSTLPEDLTEDELLFFEKILPDVSEPWLKSRLADLLWLCKKTRNPEHARIAIDTYLSHGLHFSTWYHDVNNCWERAARLCMQLRDIGRLDIIKDKLFLAFKIEDSDNKRISLSLAELMDKLNIDLDFREDIAFILFNRANELMGLGNFNEARCYCELSAKKYKQSNDETGWIESLVTIADSFEKEADSRKSSSNMVANTFYGDAIKSYRRIPIKYRDDYNIKEKINDIRNKVSISGKASLGEMRVIKTQGIDLSDDMEMSKAHVSGKQSVKDVLLYFTGLFSGPDYNSLCLTAKENISNSPISSLFGCTHISTDGRVIAKTPSAKLNAGEDHSDNKAVLDRKIQQHFQLEIELVVKGRILPALQQILIEHRVTRYFLQALCYHSSIVPEDRDYLLGHALWLGFEYDFGSSIHLLCPNVEHIVRMKLKEVGAHTSNIDSNGIENENGLSTLIELPESLELFGENLCFEIKSLFTDSLGSNLRNEVAHGLLDDNSSSSISSIYAWWMILRIIVRSFMETTK